MTVYEHRATVTVSAGSATSVGLNVPGGLIRQVIIRANTSTTVFRATLVDDLNLTRVNWGFETHEINDMTLALAVAGSLAVNITNASVADTFTILVSIQEN